MPRRSIATLILAAVCLASTAWALELGDKAPPLKVKKWVKGDEVNIEKDKGDKIYVIEFWATWCPPCRASIPHLTEIQKKYKDKNVVVIGVSVDGEQTVGKVPDFVKDMGDKMEYTVAIDDDDATSDAYMKPFNANGIPHAFIVDAQDRLVWSGHPQFGLEEVLAAVVEGTTDIEKLIAIGKKVEEDFEKYTEQFQKYYEMTMADEWDAAAAEKLEKAILEQGGKYPSMLNQLCWTLLTDEDVKHCNKPFALQLGKLANDASKGEDPDVLDTYALALFENDKVDDAIATQKKALELGKDLNDEMKADLKSRLERYEKAKKAA